MNEEEKKEFDAEQAIITQVPKEEEIRAKIIEDFGFSEETDTEKIDRLVAKEIEGHKKLSSAIGQKIKYRELAKGVKPEIKIENKVDPEPKPSDLSSSDNRALIKADVPEEDIPDVVEWANFKKISVAEALKSDHIVNMLKDRSEFRATDKANNIKKVVTPNKKMSNSEILEKAKGGWVPEKGSPEAQQLYEARRGI